MSTDALAEVARSVAFEASPTWEILWRLHHPFDRLPGRGPVESVLSRAVHAGDVVAVVGGSGSGKSSVMSAACSPLEVGIAPVRLPLRAEPLDTLRSVSAFARHVLASLAALGRDHARLDDPQREEAYRAAVDRRVPPGRRRGSGAPRAPWLLTGGDLAAQLASAAVAVAGARRSGVADVQQLGQTLSLVEAHGLIPVLVLEDTDAWAASPSDASRRPIAVHVFREVPRLAADLPGSTVMAVHDTYRELPEWAAAQELIDRQVLVPRLGSAGELTSILAHRVGVAAGGTHLADVLDGGAVERLFELYSSTRSLRAVLVVADEAVDEAHAAGRDSVDAALVDRVVGSRYPS
ncbi:MAG: hypothetical protein KJ056_12775 [Acidimicrobiia bacterium]|nr:hypothetical protein [Acidimicrobiia bacterium]